MSWVRYDDGFHAHPKVLAAKAADPGSLALHVIANTWTMSTNRPGFVPTHVLPYLVGRRGAKWAAILVRCGLWSEVDGGFEFHDHAVYNPSKDELSKRRSEAGRKGAKARWQNGKPDGKRMAGASGVPERRDGNAMANDGIARAPRPGATDVALPDPIPELSRRSGGLVQDWIKRQRKRPPATHIGAVNEAVITLLGENFTPEEITRGLAVLDGKGFPASMLASCVNQAVNANGKPSTTDERVAQGLALAAAYEAEGR